MLWSWSLNQPTRHSGNVSALNVLALMFRTSPLPAGHILINRGELNNLLTLDLFVSFIKTGINSYVNE